MDERSHRKYLKVMEILPDVVECSNGKLVLVGGTALSLFYLNHRLSVDLDFNPVSGIDKKLKEELKGRLTKLGYRTSVGQYENQFIVQFENTSIKIEIFEPELREKVRNIEVHVFSDTKINVASLEDLLRMKIETYSKRKEVRDLFDIFYIIKNRGEDFSLIKELVSKNGLPEEIDKISDLAFNDEDVLQFKKVIINAAS
jgi:predicted nucleotidyltransferase component of viral defense system